MCFTVFVEKHNFSLLGEHVFGVMFGNNFNWNDLKYIDCTFQPECSRTADSELVILNRILMCVCVRPLQNIVLYNSVFIWWNTSTESGVCPNSLIIRTRSWTVVWSSKKNLEVLTVFWTILWLEKATIRFCKKKK